MTDNAISEYSGSEVPILWESDAMRPYVDYWNAVAQGDRNAEARALDDIRDLPARQRYLYRIQDVLHGALAHFDSPTVALDLRYTSKPDAEALFEEFNARIMQLEILRDRLARRIEELTPAGDTLPNYAAGVISA